MTTIKFVGAAEVFGQKRGDGGRGNDSRLLPRESTQFCRQLAKGDVTFYAIFVVTFLIFEYPYSEINSKHFVHVY